MEKAELCRLVQVMQKKAGKMPTKFADMVKLSDYELNLIYLKYKKESEVQA
jgi:hypothetical protein